MVPCKRRSIGQYSGLSQCQSHVDVWIGLYTVIPYHTYTDCFYNGGRSTESPQAVRWLLTAFRHGVKGVPNATNSDTKVWRRTRTDCLSYYCPQLPLVCFLKHHRSRTYVQGAFLLQHHAPHIFFKIGGNETNKPPPIQISHLLYFCLFSPYPQCLIVLWVHYLNYNF